MTVSLDRFAKVDPSVLQVGANTNRLIGLMLTQNAEFPVQAVKAYASLDEISAAFGVTSQEYKSAAVYFGGFDGCTQYPQTLYVAGCRVGDTGTVDGADAGTIMTNIAAQSQKWATVFCAFDPSAIKADLATWLNNQNAKYLGAIHDTTEGIATAADGASWAETIASYNGVAPVYLTPEHAAFIAAISASVDFTTSGSRVNAAFRSQSGLTPSVSDNTTFDALVAKGYNFYVSTSGPDTDDQFLYPGCVTGKWAWLDTYINQMWLNRAFQANLFALLRNVGQIPYTTSGTSIAKTSLQTVITQALDNGVIQPGVTLSASEIATITSKFGSSAASAIQSTGYYLYLKMESTDSATRASRKTPSLAFYYTDGQSVQSFEMASVEVQ